jgi:hypothetical protein
MHNLCGQRGTEALTAELKAALGDEDQFVGEQIPNGVDGPVLRLRGP